MAQRRSAYDILARSRREADALADKVGVARMRRVLKRAQKDLNQRLEEALGRGLDEETFTIAKMRTTLEQIRIVTGGVQNGIRSVTLTQADEASEQGVQRTVQYINAAEKQFSGIATPLRLDEASFVDEVSARTNASVLRRLASDPSEGRGPGILQRYGMGVVSRFEEELQQRVVQNTPWAEVRERITAASPFLQAQPAYWAERIVRTETMAVSNAANLASIHKADEQLGDMCKILACSFDDRTGPDSIDVHGQIRRLSEPFDTWYGAVMSPPDRPNDRGRVVPQRVSWPIPDALKPRSRAEVIARWLKVGRKGMPPPRPLETTIPLDSFGKDDVEDDDAA